MIRSEQNHPVHTKQRQVPAKSTVYQSKKKQQFERFMSFDMKKRRKYNSLLPGPLCLMGFVSNFGISLLTNSRAYFTINGCGTLSIVSNSDNVKNDYKINRCYNENIHIFH